MGARREILASHYQRSSMCFAIGIARLAPTGLLAAKNNSKMGEFIEFRKVRLVGATLAKVDSRRARYNSAICSLPEERCCPRSPVEHAQLGILSIQALPVFTGAKYPAQLG